MTRIDDVTYFEGTNVYYQFYEDRDDIADNLLRPWKGEIGEPLAVSIELVRLIEEIYRQALIEIEDATEIHPDKALKSTSYDQYIENVS